MSIEASSRRYGFVNAQPAGPAFTPMTVAIILLSALIAATPRALCPLGPGDLPGSPDQSMQR